MGSYASIAGMKMLKDTGHDAPVFMTRDSIETVTMRAVVTVPTFVRDLGGLCADAKALLIDIAAPHASLHSERRLYYRDRYDWWYSHTLGESCSYQVDRKNSGEFYDWLVAMEKQWLIGVEEPVVPAKPVVPVAPATPIAHTQTAPIEGPANMYVNFTGLGGPADIGGAEGPEGPVGPAGRTELFETTTTPAGTTTTATTTPPLDVADVAATETTKMSKISYDDDKMTKLKDWTGEVALAGAEGAKDGTALAAADIIIEALEAAILPKLPFLAVYKYNSFTEALGKMAFLWSVGAADRLGFLGDVGVAPVAARAVRALATVHVAPLGLRLIEPLRDAMKKVQVLDGLSSNK